MQFFRISLYELGFLCGKMFFTMKFPILGLIRFYKAFLSPFLPPSCRFEPSCSTYAMEAVERYGAIRGTWLATKRILRCQPFCKGGFDPVK
jgi:uncharacterized protein